jgi:hypothetical protein
MEMAFAAQILPEFRAVANPETTGWETSRCLRTVSFRD